MACIMVDRIIVIVAVLYGFQCRLIASSLEGPYEVTYCTTSGLFLALKRLWCRIANTPHALLSISRPD